MGVATGCGCKYRYIDFLILLIPTCLVLVLFCSSIPTFCSFLKMFFVRRKPNQQFLTSCGTYINYAIIAMLYSFHWKLAIEHDGGV